MPFSKLLSIPFAIGTLVFLYLTWTVDSNWSTWFLVAFLPLALLYIMSAEIDWWWYERNPPELEEPMAQLLEKGLPFYQNLDATGKKRFRNKVAMFIIGNAWVPQVWEKVPRDVQVAIAAQAVIPLFDRPEWLYKKYETIVVHPKGFMSPNYPFNHYSELHEPDACLIFSAEKALAPLLLSPKPPSVVLYEYARIAAQTGVLAQNEGAQLSDEALAAMKTALGIDDVDLPAAAYQFNIF